MPMFPMFVNLVDRDVLVVGGGAVAQRKVEALLKAGARVQIHARKLNPALTSWLAQGRLQRLQGEFECDWIDRVWLVVAATDDPAFNTQLAKEAALRKRLINVVDDAELSTFHVPAIVDRDPLQIAISSGGAAPMLARRLRERFETELDESLGTLASLFASNRESIRSQFPDLSLRRRWFDHVLDGPIPRLIQDDQLAQATTMFSDALAAGSSDIERRGQIIVLDVSHADPGRLTLSAQRALNIADLLVCEGGASPLIVDRARRDADRVDAPVDDVTLAHLLIDSAQAGMRVVYLRTTEPERKNWLGHLRRECDRLGIACRFPTSPSDH